MFRRLAAVALLAAPVLGGAPAAAQTPTIADSVMKLNRAGLWELAGPLAMRSLPTAKTAEDRCALLIGGAYSAAMVLLVEAATSTLRTIDAECLNTAVARQQAVDVASIRAAIALPAMPKTGVELSALDQFWAVADILSRDAEPSDDQWRALLTTPTYRMVLNQNPSFRNHMSLAFKPSRRAESDSMAAKKIPGTPTIAHLRRALAARAELIAICATLEKTMADSMALAVRAAARFLPPGATQGKPVPFVAVGIYTNDGYAQGQGVILDVLFIRDNGLTDLVSHELHHMYASSLNRVTRPLGTAPEATMIGALFSLRNEGIADLVDKPHPLASRSAAMAAYVSSYNDLYDRTPAILHAIDSMLVVASADSTKLPGAGQAARALLLWNAHPNGAYMARTIHETFGIDSVLPAIASPFAFVRLFRAAEAKRGNPPSFSPTTVAWLDAQEKKYRLP